MPGWIQKGEARSYDTETLFDYMNGNSEGYFAYGFTLMRGVTCTNEDGDQLVIDVSELGDPDRAWGFFVTNRDQRSPVEAIGSGGQVLPRKAALREGPLLRRDRGEPGQGPPRGPCGPSSRRCVPRVPGEAHVPEAVAFFPPEGLEPGLGAPRARERPRPARPARRASSDSTRTAAPSSSPETDPAAAQATLAKLRERFPDARPWPPASATRLHRSGPVPRRRLVVFRKGARVAGVANVPAGQDALPLAKALAARLP